MKRKRKPIENNSNNKHNRGFKNENFTSYYSKIYPSPILDFFQLQPSLDTSIQKLLIYHFHLPSDLIFIIEEYYSKFEYILETNDLISLGKTYGNWTLITNIFYLFGYFLQFFYLVDEHQKQPVHILEITSSKPKRKKRKEEAQEQQQEHKICLRSFFITYRIIIKRNEINNIISHEWTKWSGDTIHFIPDCCYETKKLYTFDPIRYPFYHLLESLTWFVEKIIKNNLNLKISFLS